MTETTKECNFKLQDGGLLVNGEKKKLQAKEVKLLNYFISHANRIVSRQDLLKDVWGYEAEIDTRTIDIHVSHLRKKLGETCRHGLIKTIHGIGYRFTPENV